ncbi:MAG: DNA polymerase III subunit delta' [Ectothiorhodospiraceae bacterium]|nr:DNA polymerase III subunit delta' [Ectothiorhodospiraceae bacterium]
MTDLPALPWQARQWDRLRAALAADRLAHALLLRGPRGVGKGVFARRLARLLLCEARPRENEACGRCRACALTAAGTHPDWLTVSPEPDRATIGIAQIRDLIEQLGLTAHHGGYKVVLVDPAQACTREAANTLLKTLEEPPGAVVFLLVAHQAALLPATVRSRCQSVTFPVPDRAEALTWLARAVPDVEPAAAEAALDLAGGAPLDAVVLCAPEARARIDALTEDLRALLVRQRSAVDVAGGWQALGAVQTTERLTRVLQQAARVLAGSATPSGQNRDGQHAAASSAMQALVAELDFERLFELHDACRAAWRGCALRQGLNEQLLLEQLAVTCRESQSTRPAGR